MGGTQGVGSEFPPEVPRDFVLNLQVSCCQPWELQFSDSPTVASSPGPSEWRLRFERWPKDSRKG